MVFSLFKVPRVQKFLLQPRAWRALASELWRPRSSQDAISSVPGIGAPPYLQVIELAPYYLTLAFCGTSRGQARGSHLDATPFLAAPRKTWSMCVSRSEFNLQLEEASGKCVLPHAPKEGLSWQGPGSQCMDDPSLCYCKDARYLTMQVHLPPSKSIIRQNAPDTPDLWSLQPSNIVHYRMQAVSLVTVAHCPLSSIESGWNCTLPAQEKSKTQSSKYGYTCGVISHDTTVKAKTFVI